MKLKTNGKTRVARLPSILGQTALFVAVLLAPSSAGAVEILLAGAGYHGPTDVVPRLEGLGHMVTVSDPSTWDASFDYSPYDVIAFEHWTEGSQDPADILHLVDAVDAGEVGVVFFRGGQAEATAAALGLIGGGQLMWQTPASLGVVDNSHFITEGLALGPHDLGYTYMSYFDTPGASTTILGNGPNGAALLVHDSRRVVGTPFFGHSAGYGDETETGFELTDRSVQWASIPEPATLSLLAMGALAVARRRRA